jgi:hypothetical protein
MLTVIYVLIFAVTTGATLLILNIFAKRSLGRLEAEKINKELDYYHHYFSLNESLEQLYDYADRIVGEVIKGGFASDKKKDILKKLSDYMTLHVTYRIRSMKNVSELYHAIWSFRRRKTKGFHDPNNPRYHEVKIALGNELCSVFSDTRMHFAQVLGLSHEEILKLFKSLFDPFFGKPFEYDPEYLTSLYWVEKELSCLRQEDAIWLIGHAVEEMQYMKKILQEQNFTASQADWDW